MQIFSHSNTINCIPVGQVLLLWTLDPSEEGVAHRTTLNTGQNPSTGTNPNSTANTIVHKTQSIPAFSVYITGVAWQNNAKIHFGGTERLCACVRVCAYELLLDM